MNKKLAIIIHGVVRCSPEVHLACIENVKEQFSKLTTDFDTYIFTWKTLDGVENVFSSHVTKVFAEEPCPTSESLDEKGIPYTQFLSHNMQHAICRASNYAQVYGMDYAIKKIEETGHTYEWLAKTRNDLILSADWNQASTLIDEKAYVTPPITWGDTPGINDHLGIGKFETVKNIWSYDHVTFCQQMQASWNFESYLKNRVYGCGYHHQIFGVDKYILKRAGRTDGNNVDWVLR